MMKASKREGDHDMKEESRIVRLETVVEHIQYVLDRIDKRFDSLEQTLANKFNKIDLKFDKIDERFHDLHKESKVHFRWLMAFGLAILGSPLVPYLINYFHSVKI